MLSKEKQWYDSQSVDVPFVQFFDNAGIIGKVFYFLTPKSLKFRNNFINLMNDINICSLTLDVFDNKTKGIFTLLNDECAFPSTENFANRLKNAWIDDKTPPISWDIRGRKSKENVFLIRHFTNEVAYSTVCIF